MSGVNIWPFTTTSATSGNKAKTISQAVGSQQNLYQANALALAPKKRANGTIVHQENVAQAANLFLSKLEYLRRIPEFWMMHHLTSSLILLLESVSLNKIAAGMLKDRIFQMVDCIANPSSGLVARLHSSGEILAPEDLFPLESLLVRIIRYVELLVRDDAIAFFLDNDSQRRFEEYDKAIIITTDNMVQKFSDGVDYKMDRFFVDQLRPRQYFIACNLRYSPSSARLFALIDGPQPLRSEQGKLSDVGKAVKILTNEFENLNSEANAVTSLSLVGLIKQTAMKAFWLSNFGTTHTVNSKEFCSRLLLAVQESELQQEMKQRTKLPKPQAAAILVGNPDVKSEISLSVAQQQQSQSPQRDIDSAKYLPQIIKKTFCHDAYDVLHVIEVAKAVRHIPEEETLHGAVKSIVSLGVKMCIRNIPPPVRVLSRVAWNATEKAQMRLLLTYRGWVGVIGPRGSGKTTRLLDVVHSLPKDRDAVWVNLAGVTRCEDVRHRVASQLLLRDADSSRDFERKLRSLFESLREGSVVVFDNIPDQIVASSRGMVAGSIAATASVAAAATASSSGVAVAGTASTGSAAQPRIESMSSTAAQPSGLAGRSHHEPLEYSDYFEAISRISQDFHCKLCFVTLSTSEIKIHSYLEGHLAPTKLPSQVDLKDQTTLLKRPKNFFGKLMIVELLSHSAAVAWAEDIYPCSSEMLTRVGQSIGPNGVTDVAETNDSFPGMGAVIAAGDALTYAGGAIAAASSALVVTVTGAGPPVPQDKPSRALSLALAGGKYAGDMVSLTRFGYFEAIRRAQDRVNPRVLIERECLEDFSRDEMLCAGSLVGVNSIVDAGLAWALCKKMFQGDMVRWLIAWKGLVRRGWLTEELGLGYTVPKGFKPSYATALSSPTVARGLSIEEYYRNKSLIFPGFTIPMISAAELSELVTTLMPPLPALPALPALPSLPLLSSGLVENGILKDGEEEEMKEDSDDETVVDPESIVESSGRGDEAGEKGDAVGSGAVQSDPARVGGDDEDKDAATSPSVSPSHSPVEASDSKFPPPKLESPAEADYPTYKKHTSTPVAVPVSAPVPAPMRFNRSAYLMYWAEQAARINKEAAVTSTALLFYDANITHFRVLFERLCLEATSLSIHSGFHADKNLAGVGMILAGNLSRLLNYRVTAAHGVEITRAVLSVLANTDQGLQLRATADLTIQRIRQLPLPTTTPNDFIDIDELNLQFEVQALENFNDDDDDEGWQEIAAADSTQTKRRPKDTKLALRQDWEASRAQAKVEREKWGRLQDKHRKERIRLKIASANERTRERAVAQAITKMRVEEGIVAKEAERELHLILHNALQRTSTIERFPSEHARLLAVRGYFYHMLGKVRGAQLNYQAAIAKWSRIPGASESIPEVREVNKCLSYAGRGLVVKIGLGATQRMEPEEPVPIARTVECTGCSVM